ncbi:MAG: hypothetical protein NTU49_01475 [Gammaproteobacteria bacterium]|nr:hypothetical protein [Gammaproteobacteria bacterium]
MPSTKPVILPEDKISVYLLFHPPMDKARTGHCGLLFAKQTASGPETIYYFSPYHDLKPDTIRRKSAMECLESVASYAVLSYVDDVVMRGRSWERMIDLKLRENESVRELIDSLPTDPALQERYFNRGRFKYAVQLLESFDAKAAIEESARIEEIFNWAMFGEFTRSFLMDSTAYNCCSGIESALAVGSHKKNISRFSEIVDVSKKALWTAYFSAILFSRDITFSTDNPLKMLFFLPFIVRLAQCINNARLYMNDILAMRGNESNLVVACIRLTVYLVNLLGAPLMTDACSSAFTFPANLVRRAQFEYGGKLMNTGLAALPEPVFSEKSTI